ncbi:hypothetical protein F1559_004884 [Cyanidiococcus yangmingshanensis]|uniref:Uncharacterized protein n=1 Tax=Cyanidiococcus yangmingshanensis TaxID=2690220 RepID=A0A7J7IQK4_9RHOD|nr:hypothetical protein F1559_004884 [Cyanidiococcus yangmingshanensis]
MGRLQSSDRSGSDFADATGATTTSQERIARSNRRPTPASKAAKASSEGDVVINVAQVCNENDVVKSSELVRVQFRLYCCTEFGDSVAVAGSHEKLGDWQPDQALKLAHRRQVDKRLRDCWETELELPAGTTFEYKFIRLLGNDVHRVQWEVGPDRRAIVQRTANDFCIIESEWERTFVHFSIYFPTKEGQRLYVTGDPLEIGRWVEPGPVPMALTAEEERLETGGKGRRWELTISVPTTLSKFGYRYVLVDERANQTIWEREPNRYAVLEHAVNGLLECRDANFVASLDFDEIPPDLYIGPYPQTPEHVEAMHQAGITAVLNLQTDEDFAHRNISWPALEAKYKELSMQIIRYPIPDFNAEALERLLPGAVRALDTAVKTGQVVYVHCTAGMGRAPAVVVAYLVWCRGMSLPDALDYVRRHRSVAAPNVSVLEKVLRNPL